MLDLDFIFIYFIWTFPPGWGFRSNSLLVIGANGNVGFFLSSDLGSCFLVFGFQEVEMIGRLNVLSGFI